jgi:response regulator RpfG family c-di-GMP phosphodiesterase
VIFGFLLQKVRVLRYDKQLGALRLRDMTIVKFMLSSVIVGALAFSPAGSNHDIGKLSIPAEILSKPAKLSEIEFSLIKEHAQKGFEMLKDVESPWPLAEIVHQHHERMDGSGYPRSLKRDEILIVASILAVADVVESMASPAGPIVQP